MHFFRTLNSRPAHVKGRFHKINLFIQHALWQFKKRLGSYPKLISFGPQKLILHSIVTANSCGSLINLFGYYDGNLNLLHILKPVLKNAVFFDVGANIGVYSLTASLMEAKQVYSFEAHPNTASLLQENIIYNHLQNVTIVNSAVSDKPGRLIFSNQPGSSMNHVIIDDHIQESSSIEVPAISLDDFSTEHQLSPVGVKIDVEGHEIPVLKGAQRLLNESFQFVFLEENHPTDIVELMLEHGFLGPYYFHTRKRMLTHSQIGEDAVYLKAELLEFIQKQGVNVEA